MERNRETNWEEVYDKSQMCIKYIKDKMERIYPICENTRTIEQSNRIYESYLAKYKAEAFKMVETSLVKPHIVYNVNKYYQPINN